MAAEKKKASAQEPVRRLGAQASDQEILSFILRLADPKCDAERAAAVLLDRSSGLADVLDTPPEFLAEVPGITPRTASLLAAYPDIFRRYQESKDQPRDRILDTQTAFHAVRNKFYGRKEEIMVLLILDSKGFLRYMGIIAEGLTHSVPLYIREIIRLCLAYKADTIYIAHNHPSGSCTPSVQDIACTKEIEWALSSIDVILSDHFIFTDEDFLSMRSSGILRTLRQEIAMYKKQIIRGK